MRRVSRIISSVTALGLAMSCAADAGTVVESAREIPVAAEVDVLVVGGTSAGVSAATAAAKRGAVSAVRADLQQVKIGW